MNKKICTYKCSNCGHEHVSENCGLVKCPKCGKLNQPNGSFISKK